jgi:hypothetical protein
MGIPAFPESYGSGRTAFLAGAARHKATVESYPIKARGPHEEELAIDTAYVGPQQPQRVLVISSGIHGVEGFLGSAVQDQLWQQQLSSLALPQDTALLMIHALNPYGFAHIRRVNESNVDLNRNFCVHPGGHSENPGYDLYYDILNPKDLDPDAEQERMVRLGQIAQEEGMARMQAIISSGQYKHPTGLQFGGARDELSNTHMRAITQKHLQGVPQVTWVDFHTGLGVSATVELMFADLPASPAFARGQRFYGERARSIRGGESVSADLSGVLAYGVEAELGPDTQLTMAMAEFGTHNPLRVFMAFRADNWLAQHGDLASEQARQIKAELKEAFCPDAPEWQTEVLRVGADVINKAVVGLTVGG